MPTDLDLANQSLGLIGQDAIQTLTRSNTTALGNKVIPLVNLYLPEIKKYTLAARDWRCARKRATPAIVGSGVALDNDSMGEWRFAYRLPGDYIMMRRFVSERVWKRHRWAVEVDSQNLRILYTNVENAKIVYTYHNTNVETWDHLLFDAAAHILGSKLAASFARDFKVTQMLMQTAFAAYDEAAGAETSYEMETGSNFVDARLGGPTAGDFFDIDPAGLESPLFP